MATSREYHLKKTYGIDLHQYSTLLEVQGGCCAICGRLHQDIKGRRLSVDHNHRTGEVRGLLCTFCNRYVIGRHNDADLFLKAYEYLKKGTGLYVPVNTRRRRRKRVNRSKRSAKSKS